MERIKRIVGFLTAAAVLMLFPLQSYGGFAAASAGSVRLSGETSAATERPDPESRLRLCLPENG